MFRYTLIFIVCEERVLLLNRRYTPHMGKWNGIGGKIEAGESPEQCALRETREETGLRLDRVERAGDVVWVTETETTGMHLFTARVPASAAADSSTPQRTEEGLLDWLPLAWVLDPNNTGIADNLADFLPAALAGERIEHRYTFDRNDVQTGYTQLALQG